MTDTSGIRVKRVTRETATDHGAGDAGPGGRPALRTGRSGFGGETKPFYLTSEFLLTLATIAGLLVFGYLNDDDTLHTWRTWLLVTAIASAYVLSRGIAKAGSRNHEA